MGLFSNKNKPCPICGSATPRLLATKLQGEPLCSDCADQAQVDFDIMKDWTVEQFKEHLAYREKNKQLVDSFTPTRTLDCGRDMMIDDHGRMFFMKQWTVSNPPIIYFDEIAGFDVKVGWEVVESWGRGMPRAPFQPPQLGLASTIVMIADAFNDDDDRNKSSQSKSETLKVTLKLNNPYIKEYELCDFSVYGSNMVEFERDYAREAAKLNATCNAIVTMTGANVMPGGTVSAAPAAPAAPTADRTADDILKFKELLDAGVITQAEFDAKKKQLLGI